MSNIINNQRVNINTNRDNKTHSINSKTYSRCFDRQVNLTKLHIDRKKKAINTVMVKTCAFDSLADLQWHHIIIVISRPYLVIPKFIGHFVRFQSAAENATKKRTRQQRRKKRRSLHFFPLSLAFQLQNALLHKYKEYSEKKGTKVAFAKVTTNISFQLVTKKTRRTRNYFKYFSFFMDVFTI